MRTRHGDPPAPQHTGSHVRPNVRLSSGISVFNSLFCGHSSDSVALS
jgi:hypothetical protein